MKKKSAKPIIGEKEKKALLSKKIIHKSVRENNVNQKEVAESDLCYMMVSSQISKEENESKVKDFTCDTDIKPPTNDE